MKKNIIKLLYGLLLLGIILGVVGLFTKSKENNNKNKVIQQQSQSQQANESLKKPFSKISLVKSKKSMKIESSAFSHEGQIPSKYTCDGDNSNPPLSLSEVPSKTQTLVLIMEDPDVPQSIRKDGMWDHWLVWNIPPTVKEIGEKWKSDGVLGKNTGGTNSYQGPCPPDKEHRYFFKIFALDTTLVLDPATMTKQQLLNAMMGHILDQSELMGRYNRKK